MLDYLVYLVFEALQRAVHSSKNDTLCQWVVLRVDTQPCQGHPANRIDNGAQLRRSLMPLPLAWLIHEPLIANIAGPG